MRKHLRKWGESFGSKFSQVVVQFFFYQFMFYPLILKMEWNGRLINFFGAKWVPIWRNGKEKSWTKTVVRFEFCWLFYHMETTLVHKIFLEDHYVPFWGLRTKREWTKMLKNYLGFAQHLVLIMVPDNRKAKELDSGDHRKAKELGSRGLSY